ncbi:MAG: DNA replication and repair protein RecF, partial [Clostridia bacterium]|nr:DNA replication and repair protein RecF [Clostridia bacterium]
PQERRRFMDLSLSQQSKPYYLALSKYNALLAQRNKLMKTTDFAEFSTTAFIWETQMAEAAADIILKRRAFIEKIGIYADQYHQKIAGENEDITLIYESCIEGETREEIKEALIKKLEESHEKDYELGYTTVGVHREDFNITSKGIDLRKYGSQGQQRTAALVIKLAEIEYYYSESGEKPILLLDDVLSELDEKRRTALLEATAGTQTFITCTEFKENVENYHKIDLQKKEKEN